MRRITVGEILVLDQWIEAGGSEVEVERRAKVAHARLYDGREPEEIEEIERVVAEARERKQAIEGEQLDAALSKARGELTPPPAAKPERRPLYSPKRRGFMRATIESGVRAELDAMNTEARGSPFFDAVPVERPAERLRRAIKTATTGGK